MELFAIAAVSPPAETLQDRLTVAALPRLCAEITAVERDGGTDGDILCPWGAFRVERQAIRGGVRFTLPGCANALALTVTTGFPPAPDQVVIHCTINRLAETLDPDFRDSLEDFVAAWKDGLEAAFASPAPAPAASPAPGAG